MLWGRPGIPCSSRLGLRHTSGCAVCTGTTGPGPLRPGAKEPPAPAGRSRGGSSQGPLVSAVTTGGGGGNAAATRQPSLSPCVPNLQPLPAPRAHLPGRTDRCRGRRCLPARPRCSSRCPCLALLQGLPRPRVPLACLLPRVASPHPGSGALPPSEHLGGGRRASPHAQGDLGSWPSALRRKRGPLGPTCGVSLLTSQRSGGPPSASSPDD